MPAPRIASVRDSGRASSRVATPETAAVRIDGDRAGVQQRTRRAGLAVEERDEALVGVEVARGVSGRDADGLQRVDGFRPTAVRGHQPHQRPLAGRPNDEAERVVELLARERGEHLLHRVDAVLHRQEPMDVVLGEDADGSCEEGAYALALVCRRA